MENYEEIREEIRTAILFLEQRFTQAEIGKTMSNILGYSVTAKDINFLKNTRNNRWKGPAKREKLHQVLSAIRKYTQKVRENCQSYQKITQIESIIENGVRAEFDLYSMSNFENPDLTTLDQWYHKDGSALKAIEERIRRLKKRNWIMSNEGNPSYYDLIEISILAIESKIINVKTKENWYLKWFGTESGQYEYLYNHCNYQEYTLIKQNSIWKISSNLYFSHQKRQPPPLSVEPLALNVNNEEELKAQITKQVYKGNTERALEIAMQYAKTNKIKLLSNKIFVLRNSLIEINRLKNTESITFTDYMVKKKSINEVLLLI